jgi:DNA-binding PadR family transcriptional regulator
VYTTLHALLVEGLITGRRVSPKGARGARARTYYELTPRGIAISSNQRRALARMIDRGGAQPPDENERGRMAARLREACALSEFGGALERAMRKAR